MNRLASAGTVALAAILAGCGGMEDMPSVLSPSVFSQDGPMTLAISPGYETVVEGKPAYIFGRSPCPMGKPFATFILGTPVRKATSDCLIIFPSTAKAQVRIVVDGKIMDETWTVERKGTWVGLRRPSGDLV